MGKEDILNQLYRCVNSGAQPAYEKARENIIESLIITPRAMQKAKKLLETAGIKVLAIYGRTKSMGSSMEGKIKRQYMREKEDKTKDDTNAMTIILSTIEDIYKAEEALKDEFRFNLSNRRKNYLERPKTNGHRYLSNVGEHALGKKARHVEFQFMTKEMLKNAEIGNAAHIKYKNPFYDEKNPFVSKFRDLIMTSTPEEILKKFIDPDGEYLMQDQKTMEKYSAKEINDPKIYNGIQMLYSMLRVYASKINVNLDKLIRSRQDIPKSVDKQAKSKDIDPMELHVLKKKSKKQPGLDNLEPFKEDLKIIEILQLETAHKMLVWAFGENIPEEEVKSKYGTAYSNAISRMCKLFGIEKDTQSEKVEELKHFFNVRYYDVGLNSDEVNVYNNKKQIPIIKKIYLEQARKQEEMQMC